MVQRLMSNNQQRVTESSQARYYQIWKGVQASLEKINGPQPPDVEDELLYALRRIATDSSIRNPELRGRVEQVMAQYLPTSPQREVKLMQMDALIQAIRQQVSTQNRIHSQTELVTALDAKLQAVENANPGQARESAETALRNTLQEALAPTKARTAIRTPSQAELRDMLCDIGRDNPAPQYRLKWLLPRSGDAHDGERIHIMCQKDAFQHIQKKKSGRRAERKHIGSERTCEDANTDEALPPSARQMADASNDACVVDRVCVYHSILTADSMNPQAVPNSQGKFAHMGELQEVLHYGICGYFTDIDCYHKVRREAELVNDVKAALTTPGCSSVLNIEGVRDIHLTNWISDEISVYSGYDVEGRMIFQYNNDAHVFMHFEITHVMTRQGGVHRNMRHGRRVK